jgi:hypothetical protein
MMGQTQSLATKLIGLSTTISLSMEMANTRDSKQRVHGAPNEPRAITWVLLLGVLVLTTSSTAMAQPTAPELPRTKQELAVLKSVQSLQLAASTDNQLMFHSLVAPGFYAFDNGKLLKGDSLIQMVIDAHSKGMKFVWNVSEPDVHVRGDSAWIAYTNVGSIQAGGSAEPTPMTWLESAYLERHHGLWKLVFFQSSRISAPTPAKSQ